MEYDFSKLAKELRKKYPEIYFEVIEDDSLQGGFYIAVLSSGPDYAPDLSADVRAPWVFSGWRNPDQRNNMGVIKNVLKPEEEE